MQGTVELTAFLQHDIDVNLLWNKQNSQAFAQKCF